MQILASDVDFWNNYDYDTMKLMHDEKMYPPYTSLLVHSTKNQRASVILKVKGTRNRTDYTFKVSKQFGSSSPSPLSSPTTSVTSTASEELTEKLHFNTLYTTLCNSVASKWEHVGSFLEVKPNAIERIEREKNGDVNACFREMIKEWLKQINPPPTKSKILQVLRDLEFNEEANRLEEKFSS